MVSFKSKHPMQVTVMSMGTHFPNHPKNITQKNCLQKQTKIMYSNPLSFSFFIFFLFFLRKRPGGEGGTRKTNKSLFDDNIKKNKKGQ